MHKFIETLTESWRRRQSLLCVGLDPDLEKLPATMRRQRAPLFAFSREIIDATAPWVCAFKPQIACYAAVGAEAQLEQTIDYLKQHHPDIPVILDAKRGDIGPTAKLYAREAFERYRADAVTVNPYLGGDALAPFLDYVDKSGTDKGPIKAAIKAYSSCAAPPTPAAATFRNCRAMAAPWPTMSPFGRPRTGMATATSGLWWAPPGPGRSAPYANWWGTCRY